MEAANATRFGVGITAGRSGADGGSRQQEIQVEACATHSETIHPGYISASRNIVRNQGIEIDTVPWSDETGIVDASALEAGDYAAVIVPYPNFFGCIEEVDKVTDWAP
ncbi:MAG: hypothetical protein U5O39_18195 [Gammaproteobacteria bacterium]|nr:hypothetical protein [Gammaproteobacteria bacterium]